MALKLFNRAPLTEARKPTVMPPAVLQAARAGRRGYVTGIPLGGATETNPGTTGTINRDDQMQELVEAYIACPWVSSCADVIARTCTAGGIQVVPNSHSLENGNALPDPPAAVKAIQSLLEWINPYHDARQLFRSIITDLQIFGDSFTEVVYVNGKPIALYPLAPQTITIESDEHGCVTGYHQSMETGRDTDFKPEQVIHVQLDAPGGSGLYGVSPTQKNLLAIETWLFAMALVKETMKRGDPLRAHVDWPISLPIAEMKRSQEQYSVRNFGAKNIGNLFETKGGTTVKELGINQINNWLLIIQQRRDEIVSGFGTPPSKVGIIEAGNIGGGSATSQDRSFRINTCGPIQEVVLEKFTSRLLVQCYGVTDWHLQFGDVDWRDDEVIEAIRDMRIRNGLWTQNRGRTDIGEPPVEGGDNAILVDRQNLVLWSDIAGLSNANVDAIKAGAEATRAKGTAKPANGQGGTSPTAPGGDTQNESWEYNPETGVQPDILLPSQRFAERKAELFPHLNRRASQEFSDLQASFNAAYNENRQSVLKELT